MKGSLFTFLSLLSFISLSHGILIGYLRMPETLKNPLPQTNEGKIQPVKNSLYFDGLLSLIWLPQTHKKSQNPIFLPKMMKTKIKSKPIKNLGLRLYK